MTVKRWAWVGRLPLFKPSDEQLARVKRWARYGAYAGAGLGLLHTEAHTPASLGFYAGKAPLILVFGGLIAGCAAVGAAFAYLAAWSESRRTE